VSKNDRNFSRTLPQRTVGAFWFAEVGGGQIVTRTVNPNNVDLCFGKPPGMFMDFTACCLAGNFFCEQFNSFQ
jgi:hypothetical protein